MTVGPILNCIVCEGVRQEILNKYTILGFFGIAPNVKISIRDFKLPVTICFFFCGTTAGGRLRVSVTLSDRSGRLIPNKIPQPPETMFDPSKPVTFFALFFEGIFPGPGEFKISLMIDDREHYSTFFSLDPNLLPN